MTFQQQQQNPAMPQIVSFAVDSPTARWIEEAAQSSGLGPSAFLNRIVTDARRQAEISAAVPFKGQPQQPLVNSLPVNFRRFALKDAPASVLKVWNEGKRVKMVIQEFCEISGNTRSVEFSFRKGLALTLAGAVLMSISPTLLEDCKWLRGYALGRKPTGMSVAKVDDRTGILFRSQISIGYSAIIGTDDEMTALSSRLLMAAVQIRSGQR